MRVHVIEVLSAAQAAQMLMERIDNIHKAIADNLEKGNCAAARRLVPVLRESEDLLTIAIHQSMMETLDQVWEELISNPEAMDAQLKHLMTIFKDGSIH